MRSRLTGFSLVEAALSLAILSFALVAIIGLFPVALQTARESSAETRATLIARRIVDEIQSLAATNISLVRAPSVTNVQRADFRIRSCEGIQQRPAL